MLESFTLATFTPLIGSPFAIVGGPGSAFGEAAADSDDGDLSSGELDEALVLLQASPLDSGGSGREPFSLLFLGRSDMVLLDETYTFRHPSLGTFPMFIVPVAQDEQGVRYEATFN